MYGKIVYFVVLISLTYSVRAVEEGDKCIKNGAPGICRNIRNCKSAIEDFKKRIFPQICSFAGSYPVVCCTDGITTPAPPVATTSQSPTKPVTDGIPVYDYVNNDGSSVDHVRPWLRLLPREDRRRHGIESLVYSCDKEVGLAAGGSVSRSYHCHHNTDDLIVGGEDASQYEFPHMVLLGYGDQLANVQWLCGGSLISDKFVLTAGHCTVSRDFGPITFALMGALKRSQAIDSSKLRRVKRIISHPQYAPPTRYHDIALLELDAPVTLSQYLVPACIHVPDPADNLTRASATGWGLTEHRGANSDILQKVTLNKFVTQECSEKFPVHRHMKQGFDQNTQTCYGDKNQSKDTCQGDSGGPLQIKNKKIKCMYTIVGVTSFGKACGMVGDPGIYTRVSHYVDWIEKEVWP
ncbi:hypothetical protein evm_013802 [Chilo suppressalis]|nr:hypothetical protein evm_013802 [Chilo suppressalis]